MSVPKAPTEALVVVQEEVHSRRLQRRNRTSRQRRRNDIPLAVGVIENVYIANRDSGVQQMRDIANVKDSIDLDRENEKGQHSEKKKMKKDK